MVWRRRYWGRCGGNGSLRMSEENPGIGVGSGVAFGCGINVVLAIALVLASMFTRNETISYVGLGIGLSQWLVLGPLVYKKSA